MEEEEKSKGFKVEDRRRFSSAGELKPEYQGETPEPPPSRPPAASAAQTATPPPQAVREEALEALGEMNFASFMVGLSTQALLHLGEIQDPTIGATTVDLPAAQQLIDIVAMLREKTRGNLDKQEQALIDAILFELQMKYVEKNRRS